MAIATSGQICFSQLQSEFGGSNPICLSEYYRNGSYVPGTETTGVADWEDPFGIASSPASITITRYFNYTNPYTVRYERGPIRRVDGPWVYSFPIAYGVYRISYYVRAFVDGVLWNPYNMKDGWIQGGGGFALSASPQLYNTGYTNIQAATGTNYALFGPQWVDQYKDDSFTKVYTYVQYTDGSTSTGGAAFYNGDRSTQVKTPHIISGLAGLYAGTDNILSDTEIHLPGQPPNVGENVNFNYRTATMIPVGTTTTKNINTSVPTSGQSCLSNFRGAYKP